MAQTERSLNPPSTQITGQEQSGNQRYLLATSSESESPLLASSTTLTPPSNISSTVPLSGFTGSGGSSSDTPSLTLEPSTAGVPRLFSGSSDIAQHQGQQYLHQQPLLISHSPLQSYHTNNGVSSYTHLNQHISPSVTNSIAVSSESNPSNGGSSANRFPTLPLPQRQQHQYQSMPNSTSSQSGRSKHWSGSDLESEVGWEADMAFYPQEVSKESGWRLATPSTQITVLRSSNMMVSSSSRTTIADEIPSTNNGYQMRSSTPSNNNIGSSTPTGSVTRAAGTPGASRKRPSKTAHHEQVSRRQSGSLSRYGGDPTHGRRFYINPRSGKDKSVNHDPIVVGPRWIRQSPTLRVIFFLYLAILRSAEARRRAKGHPFIDNTVRTARYTVFSFLPSQLFTQFSKVANIYFLIISALQAIPGLSPTGRFTTIFPLMVFIIVSMAKEAYDDYFRHRHDAVENKAFVQRFVKVGGDGRRLSMSRRTVRRKQPSEKTIPIDGDHIEMTHLTSTDETEEYMWEQVYCKNLQVGDVVLVKKGDFIPADLIVLASSNDNGVCFIETSNLDGETNLKQRQALKETSGAINNLASLAAYHAKVNTESPSGDLYHFEGSLTDSRGQYPLTINQLLQRGSTLRNTNEIFGLIVYSGEESKIRMNSNQAVKTKVPTLEKQTNRIILAIFAFLITFCAIFTVAFIRWDISESVRSERHWYLVQVGTDNQYYFVFFTFLILFNAFIPISLYVTMEVVKVAQVFMMNNDLDMYDEERDIPMEAKTSSLNEELGQVQYIFSDKTGTLTENVMEFRMFSCAGHSVRHFSVPEASAPDSIACGTVISQIAEAWSQGKLNRETQQMFDFLEAVALCHSAVPEIVSKKGETPQFNYQASSADEVALLDAARDMYFTFTARSPTTVGLNLFNSPEDTKYEILYTIEFTSNRKRMSTIYRYPNGRIVLICKGADSVIMERLKDKKTWSASQRAINEKTFEHTEAYAIIGLRTLLYGVRVLEEQEFAQWADKYEEASTSLENRSKKVEEVAEAIERDFELLGATAIEDKLQEGVPETIEKLRRANIRLWMLTGDKTETAINIGRTCSIIKKESEVGIVKYDANLTQLQDQVNGIRSSIAAITNQLVDIKTQNKDSHFVIVVEGDIMTKLEKDLIEYWKRLDSNHHHHTNPSTLINKKRKRNEKSPEQEPVLDAFLDLAIAADNVICCRFSPSQKALIVSQMKARLGEQHGAAGASPLLTKLNGGPLTSWQRFVNTICFVPRNSGVTLAIGDGANDIPMIESAHVGIGITGREGLAAARASDYSIAKFRFLLPLLLVHGRWSYVRISEFTLGTFYKNFAFYGTQAVFQAWTGWTGTSLYEQWTLALNNVVFTSLPVFIVGVYEKDLNRSTLMGVPELYRYGQENKAFNFRVFGRWMLHGIWHALLSVMIPAILYNGIFWRGAEILNTRITELRPAEWARQLFSSDGSGPYQETSLFALGTISYTVSIAIVTLKVLYVESSTITMAHHIVALLSFGIWFPFNYIYQLLWGRLGPDYAYESYGLWYPFSETQIRFWGVFFLTIVFAFLLDYADITFKNFNKLARWGPGGGRAGSAESPTKSSTDSDERRKDPYKVALEDANFAASQAIGAKWADDVEWWKGWEKHHGVTSSLGP
ncbi:hypothetical protein HDV05_000551 [Chytridiales sp. JEL 0842]|nr:hypothetical protein HDV05_000551 [Chytridiales sp. JEL 0842]